MCIYTPIYISFSLDDFLVHGTNSWYLLNLILDFIFLIDIAVVFFSAFYDEDFKIVDDFKIIATNYLRGWFVTDIIAIIPFDLIVINNKAQKVNSMIRIVKIGRIYKIIKLTRLLRMVKIMNKRNQIFQLASQLFQFGNGLQRIAFFIISSLLVCHIFACLWIFFT